MPHIIVEHSADIADIPVLLEKLHHNLSKQDTVTLESIKTRAIEVQHAIVGNSDKKLMLHIIVKLLSGRPDDLLNKISGDLREIACTHCGGDVSVTVETVSLYNASYRN